MSTSPSAPTATSTPKDSGPRVTRGHSCVLCSTRKVRCDGGRPCSNCVKAKAECVAPQHSAPRRKRKLGPDDEEGVRVKGPRSDSPVSDVLTRLRMAEDLLQKHGLKLEDSSAGDGSVGGIGVGRDDILVVRTGRESEEEKVDDDERKEKEKEMVGYAGKLIVEKGNSRYIESSLWAGLSEEIQDSRDLVQASSDDETVDTSTSQLPVGGGLLFGRLNSKQSLLNSHPPPVKIFQLWQTFIDNINPLVKAVHVPTMQQIVIEATGKLDQLDRPTEALLFAIYHCSVVSLRNEDCESMLGDTRWNLMMRFSQAAQQALINAEVLRTSNFMVLQALTYYLLSIRQYCDADTLWMLAGVAVRIGQRIGLHRENAQSKLSVFEAEIRRRLWWQILILDNRSAQMSGIYPGFEAYSFSDSKPPSNLNDSDLYPTMKELPPEHKGATEMIFCCIRYEIGFFISQTRRWESVDHDAGGTKDVKATIRSREKSIKELESLLERKYLKYCDSSVPLHLLASLMARTAVCQMSLMAHHPRNHQQSYDSLPQSEKDILFQTSLKMIEYDNLGHSNKSVQGYLWHVNVFFQLNAFIHILSELRFRVLGDVADFAWKQIAQVYEYHPEMLNNTKYAVFFAVGNLAVKAWEKRALALQQAQRGYQINTPRFMSILMSQRKRKGGQPVSETLPAPDASNEATLDSGVFDSQTGAPGSGYDFQYMGDANGALDPTLLSEYIPMDMDWQYWQTLFEGNEGPAI